MQQSSPGIGIVFGLQRPAEEIDAMIAHVMTRVPDVLAGIAPRALDQARAAAILRIHSDGIAERKALRPPEVTGIALDVGAASRSLFVAAVSFVDLAKARSVGQPLTVEILPRGDPKCCPACVALQGRRFPPGADVPTIPVLECTSPRGCQCTYLFSYE